MNIYTTSTTKENVTYASYTKSLLLTQKTKEGSMVTYTWLAVGLENLHTQKN
jgi:hypothetical protein